MGGLYYEELEIGRTYVHEVTRTVTEVDNLLFTTLTMNTQPLHLDAEFAKNSPFKERIVPGLLTLALVGGLSVFDLTLGTTLGNLGYDSVEFPAPVYIGDTIHAETLITAKRESESRVDAGIVWFTHSGFKQTGVCVCRCVRVGLMSRASAT